MVKRLLRRLSDWKKTRLLNIATSQGYADLSDFEDRISFYRRRGCVIGKYVRLLGQLDSINPHLIEIGDYSVIGVNSAVLTHCPIKGAQPCKIGNYVYLGWGVIVLPGVTIGDFSVIGAGSVVTRDIPDGSVAAGNPARVIRHVTAAEKLHLRETMENHRLFGWDPDRGIKN